MKVFDNEKDFSEHKHLRREYLPQKYTNSYRAFFDMVVICEFTKQIEGGDLFIFIFPWRRRKMKQIHCDTTQFDNQPRFCIGWISRAFLYSVHQTGLSFFLRWTGSLDYVFNSYKNLQFQMQKTGGLLWCGIHCKLEWMDWEPIAFQVCLFLSGS